LQVRVGIATGLVVVGDLIGSEEQAVVGETTIFFLILSAKGQQNQCDLWVGLRGTQFRGWALRTVFGQRQVTMAGYASKQPKRTA
jgi:hypothetical protein